MNATPFIRNEHEWGFNEEIGLFLTRRCPLQCAHCIVSSHPEHDDPNEDSVLHIVDAIVNREELKHVSITGGEPFLRPELLQKCCIRLSDIGKQVSVVTSAHWAATFPRAQQVLEHTLGATRKVQLWLSLDPHHSEFLPATHYAHAIEAASAMGIEVNIKALYTNDPEEGIQFVQERISTEHLSSVNEMFLQPLFLLGRANGLESNIEREAPLPNGLCGRCSPHINDQGKIIGCCGVFDTKEGNPLHIGNVLDSDLGSLLAQSDEDWLIQAIRTLGPARLAALVAEESSKPDERGRYLQHDICSLCNQLMSSPDKVRALRERLKSDSKLRRKIAVLRFALYGEHQMLETTREEQHAKNGLAVSHR